MPANRSIKKMETYVMQISPALNNDCMIFSWFMVLVVIGLFFLFWWRAK